MKKILMSLGLIAAAVAPAPAANPPRKAEAIGEEARISFPRANIRSFRALSREEVYFDAGRGRWYKATLMYPCRELPWAQAIGFITRGTSTLDRFGELVVDGERCPIQSLVRSEEPPKRERQPLG
ncbi:MAG TPA: DUF6491 family protein [Allosphingosinicella sp.]|nr:DUF6491 family protein [Allosphingosinicella sp.]